METQRQSEARPARRAFSTGLMPLVCLLALCPAAAPPVLAQTTFTVTVAPKDPSHPNFGRGNSNGFVIDGVQGQELTVMRGETYIFQMQNVPTIHPFYLTLSQVGQGAQPVTDGVTGNFATGNAQLTFMPNDNTPNLIYYQCGNHARMGWRINVQGGSPPNHGPAAGDDQATTPAGIPVEINVLANDTDVDGDPLTVTAVSDPPNGSAEITGGGQAVRYTPDAGFSGTDTFTYTVSDGRGGVDQGTVTVTVTPVNSAPIALDDEAATTENTPVEIDVLANDSDPDGDPLTVVAVTEPGSGGAEITGGGLMVRYTPAADFTGADGFSYTVDDGQGGQATADVALTVTRVNTAPVAAADEAATPEDAPVAIDVLANDSDPDGDPLSITAVADPAHGAAEITDGGQMVRYTPDPDFNGADGFSYTVDDGQGGQATADVALTVTPVNDPPAPPLITDPPDGADRVIEGDPEALFGVEWTAAADPDGDPVTYAWQLDLAGDFAAPLVSADVGAATRFETTSGALGTLLTDHGVGLNEAVTVFHRALASDGLLTAEGAAATLRLTRGLLTGIETGGALPHRFALRGNFPNPFHPATRLVFDLPEAAEVGVEILDVQGRSVLTVPPRTFAAGAARSIRIDLSTLASGVYFYRVRAWMAGTTQEAVGRMTLAK